MSAWLGVRASSGICASLVGVLAGCRLRTTRVGRANALAVRVARACIGSGIIKSLPGVPLWIVLTTLVGSLRGKGVGVAIAASKALEYANAPLRISCQCVNALSCAPTVGMMYGVMVARTVACRLASMRLFAALSRLLASGLLLPDLSNLFCNRSSACLPYVLMA